MKTFWWVIVLALVALGLAAMFLRPQEAQAPSGTASNEAVATFYCGDGNTIQATFANRSVALIFSDGRTLSLPQSRSASGARYESTTTGSDLVFWNTGDNATFTNSAASTTDFRYTTCTAAHVEPAATAGLDTYTDQSKTFTFAFPTAFSPAGAAQNYSEFWSAEATTTGMELAKVNVPEDFEPGTNFADAWFSVGVSSNPSAVATCLTSPAPQQTAGTTTVTIGGVPFTKLVYSGAAAGNRYDTTSYRTVRGGECYAVEYTVHYSVFENYPPGAVTRFDEPKVQNALDAVAQSFRFLK